MKHFLLFTASLISAVFLTGFSPKDIEHFKSIGAWWMLGEEIEVFCEVERTSFPSLGAIAIRGSQVFVVINGQEQAYKSRMSQYGRNKLWTWQGGEIGVSLKPSSEGSYHNGFLELKPNLFAPLWCHPIL